MTHLEKKLKILYVMPWGSQKNNMIFAKKDAVGIRKFGFFVEEFYLASRTNPIIVFNELLRLRNTIKRFNPDVIHAQYGTVTGLLGLVAAGGKPYVLTVRGSDLNKLKSMPWLRNRVGRLMTIFSALYADYVICVSNRLKNQLHFIDYKTLIEPSCVDTEIFFPTDKLTARQALGLPISDKIVLFYAGNAPELKGLNIVMEAIKISQNENDNINLHIIEGGLSQEKIALLMNAADCFVMASEAEGSPGIIREAMACNLPIVSVDVGDVSERLASVNPSCIVDRNPEAIADGILNIVSGEQRSNGFSEIIRQHITCVDTSKELSKLYLVATGDD